jgi:hypothetical protein
LATWCNAAENLAIKIDVANNKKMQEQIKEQIKEQMQI